MAQDSGTELRVLIIEDSESDAALILRELEKSSYKVSTRRIEIGSELHSALVEDWQVILSDFRLPQFSAVAALEILKSYDRDIPFIVISQAIGEDLAVELMRRGASDYLMKSSLKRLMPAVEREIREARNRAAARLQATQLEINERNFRLLAENSADMISRHLPDGTFLYVSPAFQRILGYNPDEQVGHAANEIIHPDDIAFIERLRKRLAEAVTETRADYRLRKKDGNYIWVQSISRSRADAAGKIVEIHVATRDITSEKISQNALLASEERFRKIAAELHESDRIMREAQRAARFGTYQTDLVNGVWYCSELTDEIIGVDSSFVKNMENWNLLIAPDFRQIVRENFEQALASNSRFDMEYQIIRQNDGAKRWIWTQGQFSHDAQGKPVTLSGSVIDITERKRAEEAARENEAVFRSIIELSPVPYALNDEHGNIVYLNHAFVSLFGYTNADIPTLERWWPLAYPDPEYRRYVAHGWQARLDEARRSGNAFEVMELEITCKDGSRRTVLASAGKLGKSYEGLHLVILYDISDRKASELQIKMQESFLNSVINAQINGVMVVNAEGRITIVNDSAEKIFEISRDSIMNGQIQALQLWERIDQDYDHLPLERTPLAMALTGKKKIQDIEYGLRWPDGKVKWLSVSASPIFDSSGTLFGAVASFIDITDRHIDRQKMVRQIERLRLQEKAINSSLSGVIIADARLPDMPVTYVNEAFTQITGYEPKDVIGRNCRFLQGTEKSQPALEALRNAIKRQEPGEFILRNYRKNGSVFHSKLQLAPVRNDEGIVTHFVAIQTDITEKFEADREVEIARERMEMALNGAQLGLIDTDLETGQIFFNERYAEIVGYSVSELHAMTSTGVWNCVHPDDLGGLREDYENHLRGLKERVSVEYRTRQKTGNWVWVRARGRLFSRTAAGAPKRFTGTLLDISESKESEQKILALSQRLMNIAEIERSEIAGELHDVIGQSLVLLKLNTIQFLQANNLRSAGNEELLLKPIADTLQTVREISRRLTPSHMKKIGLVPALEDMLQGAARLSGIRIVCDLADVEGFFPENWNIQVFRIIQEALTNALKHSGATSITVTGTRIDENLEIVVADNGNGFSPVSADIGLGLEIMRERVRGLRGHLFVAETSPGVAIHVLIPSQARLA